MAHILQKHLARMLCHNQKLMPLTLVQFMAAALISLGSPDIGSQLIPAVMAAHTQSLINFTREHEKEADQIGMQILSQANFDPYAMPNVFYHLSQSARFSEKPLEYLITHPLYESRISDARNRAEQFPYRQGQDSLAFYLIQARLLVASAEHPLDLLKQYRQKLKQGHYQNKPATEYGLALVLFKLRKTQEALTILNRLSAEYPEQLIIQLTLSSIEQSHHQFKQSLARLKNLFALLLSQVSCQALQ